MIHLHINCRLKLFLIFPALLEHLIIFIDMKRIKITESQFKKIWENRINTGASIFLKHDLYKELEEFIKAIEGAKSR